MVAGVGDTLVGAARSRHRRMNASHAAWSYLLDFEGEFESGVRPHETPLTHTLN